MRQYEKTGGSVALVTLFKRFIGLPLAKAVEAPLDKGAAGV